MTLRCATLAALELRMILMIRTVFVSESSEIDRLSQIREFQRWIMPEDQKTTVINDSTAHNVNPNVTVILEIKPGFLFFLKSAQKVELENGSA